MILQERRTKPGTFCFRLGLRSVKEEMEVRDYNKPFISLSQKMVFFKTKIVLSATTITKLIWKLFRVFFLNIYFFFIYKNYI